MKELFLDRLLLAEFFYLFGNDFEAIMLVGNSDPSLSREMPIRYMDGV